MKLWNQFQSLSRAAQIGVSVAALHLFFLAFLYLDHVLDKKRVHRKMAVRTVLLKPQVFKTTAQTVKPPMKQNAPERKAITSKQSEASSSSKKGSAPKSTKTAKTPTDKQSQIKGSSETPAISNEKRALLEELAENLNLLDAPASSAFTRSSLSIPSRVEKQIVVQEEQDLNPSYAQALSAYLQDTLNLPEFGEVKAKLTLDAFGKLIDLEILETKSRKNSDFLKNRLPNLLYPCFNDFGILETENNFTITFTNAEIH